MLRAEELNSGHFDEQITGSSDAAFQTQHLTSGQLDQSMAAVNDVALHAELFDPDQYEPLREAALQARYVDHGQFDQNRARDNDVASYAEYFDPTQFDRCITNVAMYLPDDNVRVADFDQYGGDVNVRSSIHWTAECYPGNDDLTRTAALSHRTHTSSLAANATVLSS